jgi:hypothetical protein
LKSKSRRSPLPRRPSHREDGPTAHAPDGAGMIKKRRW